MARSFAVSSQRLWTSLPKAVASSLWALLRHALRPATDISSVQPIPSLSVDLQSSRWHPSAKSLLWRWLRNISRRATTFGMPAFSCGASRRSWILCVRMCLIWRRRWTAWRRRSVLPARLLQLRRFSLHARRFPSITPSWRRLTASIRFRATSAGAM